MRRASFVMAAAALVAGLVCAASEERVIVLESGTHPDLASARAAWQPMELSTPAVEIGPPSAADTPGGSPHAALRLACNFRTNTTWRVSWDMNCPTGTWDLSGCQVLRLDLAADEDRDGTPVDMIVYLHAGVGWYRGSLIAFPGRRTVVLSRKSFTTEEHPSGWDRVDRIRISAVRSDARDRAILLLRIEAVAYPVSVVIYGNDAGVKIEPGVSQFVRQTGDALDRLGITYEILGDEEVASGRLAGKKVAILPLNPVLPGKAAKAAETFVDSGGKLIVCYLLSAPLDRLLGVRMTSTLQGADRLHAFQFKPAGGEGQEPISVIQDSWLAHGVTPAGQTQVRACWIDKDGKASDEPAVTCNSAGFFVGHVLTPSDATHKDGLVQEMIGELWPGMWQAAYEARQAAFGQVAGFRNADQVASAIAVNRQASTDVATPGGPDWQALRQAASAAAAGGRFAQAAGRIARAQEALIRSYAASVPPKEHEFRAVWCHNPAGLTGMTWDEAMTRLAAAGLNAIIPNMSWGDAAAYESAVLPRSPAVKGDQLAACLAAAKRHGIAVHVWRVNWNLFGLTGKPAKAELAKEGRLQADASGKPLDWLCPSHPKNQKLELDAMLEIARKYDVAGLHFDYIRYPDDEACFCPGCRQRFEAREGRAMKNWPGDVTKGPMKQKYLEFRRDNITRLVAAVSEQARRIRPGIKISAAVFPHWLSARDDVGQDWKLWVEKGYLDFVCPMQYTDNALQFASETRQSAAWVGGRIPLMPGIGATLGNTPAGTLEQVLLARKQGASGFVLFNYDLAMLEHLELLGLGATRMAGRP